VKRTNVETPRSNNRDLFWLDGPGWLRRVAGEIEGQQEMCEGLPMMMVQ
jgi:hypothetical protein